MVDKPQWLIREDSGTSVLVALAVRQLIGIRSPDDLPSLRGLDVRPPDATDVSDALESQWREYWDMTVEPRAHRSDVPLDLVDGFDTLVALPTTGAEELREAIAPHADVALRFAQSAHNRYVDSVSSSGNAYRAYASAIAEFEREVGRRAHSFELNVQVLPFTQRGIWWIGSLSVAVTDGLRRDVVAFDAAMRPVIGELA
ncbi:zinc-binding alcohol dehydrogenase [Microbacterium sp. Mu-80]|uniref:Zinc-binding alcohol dehydrogenase n=1 Tax=Microbacterium bandirmense TaxID=3122050 RepID=A0ABU8LFK2_9MICO